MTLNEAIEILIKKEYIGDFIYNVRENEGKGWDGPRVTAYSEAVATLERHLKQ